MSNGSPKKDKQPKEGDLILTPGGWRSKSKVFKVEPGQHVEVRRGRLKVIDTETGGIVADLGVAASEEDAATVRGGGPIKKAKRPKSKE